jgi:dienelactone hydrolase
MAGGGEARSAGRSPPVWIAILILLVGLIAVAAFAGVTTGPSVARHPPTPMPYAQPGPFVAGVTTISLPYGPVEVWYPAEPTAAAGHARAHYDVRAWLPSELASRVPADLGSFTTDAYRGITPARGPFPLVLFAHGLYSFRDQSTFLTTWLATWGFVVAAPEFTNHDLTAYFLPTGPVAAAPSDYQVLVDTEQLVLRESAANQGLLHGLVRPGKISVVGHSLGGLDAMQFASRPEVASYIALAAGFAQAPGGLAAKPSLYMTGSEDHDIDPTWVETTYDAAPPPKTFVSLPKAGHLAFTDLCLIDRRDGGLGAIGSALRLTLPAGAPFTPSALDGCSASNLSPAGGFAVIRQDVIAELQATLLPQGGAHPAG